MEQPFYFTYEKVCKVMKEYLSDVDDFSDFIDRDLHDEHCDQTRCSECAFMSRHGYNQACSLVTPIVEFASIDRCQLSNEHARGLVEGLNKTREICRGYTNCNCKKCWLREGPESLYLCGGKEMNK